MMGEIKLIKFSHGISKFYLKLYFTTDFMQVFNKA